MHGGAIIRRARRRAGLSQRDLAARLGTHQSVVGRWESGATSPTFETMTAAIRACGFDLDASLREVDPDMERLVAEQRRRAPAHRIRAAAELARFRHAGDRRTVPAG